VESHVLERGADAPDRVVSASAMFVAPLLFALSSFYWSGDGQYGITGSTLLIFGSIAWIVAFVAIFRALRDVMPRYAAGGLVVAVYGTVCGGAAFAFQGLFRALYDIPHDRMLRGLADHPVVANAIFWIGGPAFPLTLVVLGVVLARTRTLAPWLGILLALGGALFPVARIPRLAGIAHAVDLMMLVPLWALGVRTWTRGLGPS
jgi:hypothetical protein